MKKITLIFLGLIVSTGLLLAGVNGSLTPTPNKTAATKVNGSYEYDISKIGTYIDDGDTYTTRSQFEFDLSAIDDHASITKVTVTYMLDANSYTFKITELATAKNSPQEIWSAVAGGTSLHSGKSYGISTFDSTPLKTSVANALDDDNLVLGFMSEKEDSTDSGSSLYFSMVIYYSVPILDLTVKNDLYGEDGGNIGMGIYPAIADTHTSPYSFTAYEGDRLNLAAYDNQDVNNKIWFFNDTEHNEEFSNWEKKKGDNFDVLTNAPSFITATLTSSDDDVEFISHLKNVSYTTSGNLSSNESWLLSEAVLTGNVNVPANTTLTLGPNVSVNLNNYKIESTGGTINVLEGAELSSNIQIRNSNDAIQGLYPSISSAISNAASGEKVCLFDECNLTSNVNVPSNIVLELGTVNKITMNGYKIVSAGGTINIDYNADIDPFIVHKNTSGKIVGLYPDLSSAVAAVAPFNDETIEINSRYDVSSNVTIPLESTLIIKSNASLDIGEGVKYFV